MNIVSSYTKKNKFNIYFERSLNLYLMINDNHAIIAIK